MVVLLVLATFGIFLTIDFLRQGRTTKRHLSVAEPTVTASASQRNVVAGFDVREYLRYHPGHTWALQESPTLIRVGLDDFAAKLTGKIEKIELPRCGQWIRQGQKFATIYKNGKKADLVSPIEGEVTNRNEAVLTDVTLPSRDPYGKGWLISVMAPDASTSLRNLVGAHLAAAWMSDSASRLRARLPGLAGAVAQDGGVAVVDIASEFPDEAWTSLVHEFFLT